jgi:hypothetical protein
MTCTLPSSLYTVTLLSLTSSMKNLGCVACDIPNGPGQDTQVFGPYYIYTYLCIYPHNIFHLNSGGPH